STEHALLARDDRDALLERGQPVHGVGCDRAAAQSADCHHHAFVGSTTAMCRACVHRHVLLLCNPGSEVDIVGSKILDNSNVSDPTWKRSLAAGGDLVDLADQAIFEALARGLQRRVVPLDVTNAAYEPF